MAKTPRRIVQIAQDLQQGRAPRRFRVRAILKWFGASRRGDRIVSSIQGELAAIGLQTDPPLDTAGIDDPVRLVPIQSFVSTPDDVPSVPAQNEQTPAVTTPANGVGYSEPDLSDTSDELESDQEEEEPVTKPDDRPVTSQICDWTISSLRDKLDRGQLELQPKFQREYVWNTKPELPSRLIRSFLRYQFPQFISARSPTGAWK